MRKVRWLFVVLSVFVFVGVAYAQTWYTANQATVGWDPVTLLGDGVTPIPAGDAVKYQVYTRIGTTGTGTPVGAEITATQLTITFNSEGRYYVGIKAVRYPAGETTGISSDVAWSNDPAVCAVAGPFGIVHFVKTLAPKGLKNVP